MITFLILWAIVDKQDETNRLLRMTPAQLARENTQRRTEEQQQIAILVTVIVLLLVILLSYLLFCQ
jgi:hypothetical protein